MSKEFKTKTCPNCNKSNIPHYGEKCFRCGFIFEEFQQTEESYMSELYEDLYPHDYGFGEEPVYLSDGVWLYPDGSMRDDRK